MDAAWIAGIALTIICSLIGVIYYANRARDKEQDDRIADQSSAIEHHIREDIAAHERIRALEVKVEQHEREISVLRQRWHDLRSEITATLSTWYADLIERIQKPPKR